MGVMYVCMGVMYVCMGRCGYVDVHSSYVNMCVCALSPGFYLILSLLARTLGARDAPLKHVDTVGKVRY